MIWSLSENRLSQSSPDVKDRESGRNNVMLLSFLDQAASLEAITIWVDDRRWHLYGCWIWKAAYW